MIQELTLEKVSQISNTKEYCIRNHFTDFVERQGRLYNRYFAKNKVIYPDTTYYIGEKEEIEVLQEKINNTEVRRRLGSPVKVLPEDKINRYEVLLNDDQYEVYYDIDELSILINRSQNYIKNNFKKLNQSMIKNSNFWIERVEKEYIIHKINSKEEAEQKLKDNEINGCLTQIVHQYADEDLEGEIWKPTCYSSKYLVSNMGRIKNRANMLISFRNDRGYHGCKLVGDDGIIKNVKVHRVVLGTFNPVEDWEHLTVDHINGNRTDNRLENLRWMSAEENIKAMAFNRQEFQPEITKLINKLGGYDNALEFLRQKVNELE